MTNHGLIYFSFHTHNIPYFVSDYNIELKNQLTSYPNHARLTGLNNLQHFSPTPSHCTLHLTLCTPQPFCHLVC